MKPLFRLLLAALLTAPSAAQVKVVPEVAAPVGGGVAGAGARSVGAPAAAPSLAAPALSLPSALPTASVSPSLARPAAAAPAQAAAPLAAAAAPAPAPAAPTPALEKVREGTAEMAELMGREGGGAEAGTQAAGVASGLFDGGLKARGPANGVSPEQAYAEGFGGAGALGGFAFARSLSRGGVPASTLGRLTSLLSDGHPGDQTKVYHGLTHSVRVANVAAAVLDGPEGRALSEPARNTLLVAAALHDYDPQRAPGSPARVSATLEVLENDPKASALLQELSAHGVDAAAVKALIKYTDFSPDAAARAKIRADADAMADAAGMPWLKVWGPRLAFVDQSAMYLDSPAFARQAVIGLANELGAPAEKVLAGTHNFLKPLLESPDFALLPAELQGNFRTVHRYFVTLAERAAGEPAEGDAAARAPPQADPVAALGRLQDALDTATNRAQAAKDPAFYRSALDALSAQLKAWQASPDSAKARTGNTTALMTYQADLKKKLLAGARGYLASRTDGTRPLREDEVASSGTSLEALLGMLFTGGMEATNPYQGFKGESAHYWAGKGLEVGAQYGATRSANRNEPGVLLIIHNAKDPLQVVGGETLSRRPVMGADIVAAVVSDGRSTLVLQGPALAALAQSSARWKDFVVSEARAGRMAPLSAWERVQRRFDR